MKKLITQFRYLRFAGFKTLLFLFLGLMYYGSVLKAQTMPAPQTVPYSQDFSTLAAAYPAGWQAWQISGSAPSSTGRTAIPASDKGIVAGTAASTSSGAYDFNGKIGFMSVASSDVALCLALNTTGKSNIKVTFDAMTIRNLYDGTSNFSNGLVLQYRVGTGATLFTNLTYSPAEYITGTTTQTAAVTTGINTVTGLNAYLPTACENQSVVQIRWIYRNAAGTSGSRPSVALDNVSVEESLPTTYTWNQTGTASIATATNWTPTRTTPLTNDILQFNGGGTVVATDLTSQTIAQLLVSNNTSVELQSAAAATLTIAGTTGTDLNVGAGSALNIAQATNAISIALSTGATASISGAINYNTTAHRLTAVDANAITFQSGAVFTAGSTFSGNAFGTTSLNSVKFNSGSTYVQGAGGNPFGATAPNSVCTFETGSLYKFTASTSNPPFSGRTYANLEIDNAVATTCTGTSAVNMDNLTITNGTLNFNVTATPGHNIKGNIVVSSGATLNFSPLSAGTINFNGSSTQTISGDGTLTVSSLSDFVVSNNVIVDKNITFGGALTINSTKALTVNAGKQLTVSTAFTNNGTLNLLSSNSGTATILPPASITGSGTTTVQQYLPDARNWYVSSPVTGAVAPAGYSYFQRDEVASSWTTRPFVADSIFLRGHGYIVLPVAAASTLQFSGTLNSGNINTTLTKSGSGFNLIGNPYPCHLGWTYDFANANAALIESSIWVRTNAGTANNSGQWSFATFNAAAVESVPSVANAGVIAPMQAFWVKAKAAGTLTLDNALIRSHQASNPLKAPAAKNTDRQRLRLQVDNGTTTDETLIYFAADASNAYDAFDSPKFAETNSVTQIFTTVDTEKLVINGMNTIPLDTPISLGFVPGSATSFSIKANEISNLPTDVKVILKDHATLAETDLTDGISTYHFSPETTSVDRFSVIFRSAGVATSINNANKINAQVFVNAANQITIIAPEKSNYTIYNAVGQLIENGLTTSNFQSSNVKLFVGVYVVKVNNQSTRVIVK